MYVRFTKIRPYILSWPKYYAECSDRKFSQNKEISATEIYFFDDAYFFDSSVFIGLYLSFHKLYFLICFLTQDSDSNCSSLWSVPSFL